MKSRLNIFVVHPSSMLTDHLPNGAGWIDFNYLRGLTDRGHTVHVAVPRLELRGPVPPRMHVYVLPQGGGMSGRLSYMWRVRKLFRRLRRSVDFDIAQQFTPVDTGLSLSLLGAPVPLVLGPYSGHWPSSAVEKDRQQGIRRKCSRLFRDGLAWLQQKQARALIITCPAAMERVVARGDSAPPVHLVSHGIDSAAYPARSGLPGKPSILFLANLEYRKGIFTLLEAFEQVAQSVPQCTLAIWGAGADAAAVKERVTRSAFRDRISLAGNAPRDSVAEIMRSHSVYCMPSHGEPFGMTLLEAMASGVPVVTTDVGGPPFIVQQGGGCTVPPGDADRLAAALIAIVSDPGLQTSMGEYNRNRIEQQFDWSKSLDRMEGVYRFVLDNNPDSSVESLWTPH